MTIIISDTAGTVKQYQQGLSMQSRNKFDMCQKIVVVFNLLPNYEIL